LSGIGMLIAAFGYLPPLAGAIVESRAATPEKVSRNPRLV